MLAETGYGIYAFLNNIRLPLEQRVRVLTQPRTREKRTVAEWLSEGATLEEWLAFFPHLSPAVAAEALLWGESKDPGTAAPVVAALLKAEDPAGRAILAETGSLDASEYGAPYEPRHSNRGTPLPGLAVPIKPLATDPAPRVRASLAANYGLRHLGRGLTVSTYTLYYGLLADPDPQVRLAARRNGLYIQHGSRSPEILVEAATRETGPDGLWPDPWTDPDYRIRANIADGHIHPADVASWARLLADPDPRVRAKVARSRFADMAPSGTFDRLAEDDDPAVRAAAAGRTDLTPEAVARLIQDPHSKVRAAAAKSAPLSPDLLARLAADPVKSVREAATRRLLAALGA